ncbi:MAG: hypothetical protein K0R13_2974 [Propionibacteriaceae bacterium]|jgi:hypothetical protein|nr:hypothetical protein [Propionibacteriaceae bacterium]
MDESMITRVQKGEDRVVVIMDRRARGGARRSRPLARCSAFSSVKPASFIMINRA